MLPPTKSKYKKPSKKTTVDSSPDSIMDFTQKYASTSKKKSSSKTKKKSSCGEITPKGGEYGNVTAQERKNTPRMEQEMMDNELTVGEDWRVACAIDY